MKAKHIIPQGAVVKVGQVWEDADPRFQPKQFTVLRVISGYAVIRRDGVSRNSRVAIRRMKPGANGYRMVKDVV